MTVHIAGPEVYKENLKIELKQMKFPVAACSKIHIMEYRRNLSRYIK